MRVTEDEVLRLVDDLAAGMWEDADELRRRIHLVARRFSLEDRNVGAPATLPAHATASERPGP
jgi:hypothetical protein